MPIIESNYTVKGLHSNMHYTSIYTNKFRKIKTTYDKRERLELEDGDFMDVDWKYAPNPSKKLIVMLHGFEGDSKSLHMLGLAKHGTDNGYDVLAINYRGCSGEQNRLFRAYHAGVTEDVEVLINHAVNQNKYDSIYIKGFSIGGNILMLYLGTNKSIPHQIKACMAASSPNDLKACSINQTKLKNWLYAKNFLTTLRKKLKEKHFQDPDKITKQELDSIKTLTDFNEIYVAKAHGFRDALDYYEKCSSAYFLDNITIPTLLLNAKNDSFLSEQCFPFKKAKNHPYLHLEVTTHGGHLGFHYNNEITYNEKRALEFFKKF